MYDIKNDADATLKYISQDGKEIITVITGKYSFVKPLLKEWYEKPNLLCEIEDEEVIELRSFSDYGGTSTLKHITIIVGPISIDRSILDDEKLK